MRAAFLFAATAATALAAGRARAQSMAGMQMPGMTMPTAHAKPATASQPKAKPASDRKSAAAPLRQPQAHDAMTGMDMSTPASSLSTDTAQPAAATAMPGMAMPAGESAHGDHDMTAMPSMTVPPSRAGTDLPPGNAPPPPVRHDRSADRFYGTQAMADAEARMMQAHGASTYHQILFNLAEYQAQGGRDFYRWSGEGWIGDAIERLAVKSEGEGSFGQRVENADVQALYSKAVGPYWNLQAGIRQAFLSGPDRVYAVIGIEGLAPYWLEVEASLFLSSKGDLLGRAEAYYDQRITQRLVLQPRAELNFAAQDVPENRIGSGLSDAELGLRLRYEIRREFAPYVGFSWERRLGHTARYARRAGESVGGASFVAGLRFWF